MYKTLKIEDLKDFSLYTRATLKKLLDEATQQARVISDIVDVISYTLNNFDKILLKTKKNPIKSKTTTKSEQSYDKVAEFLETHINKLLEIAQSHNVFYIVIDCKKIYCDYSVEHFEEKITSNNFGRIITMFGVRNNLEIKKIVKSDENGRSKRFYVISKKEQNV